MSMIVRKETLNKYIKLGRISDLEVWNHSSWEIELVSSFPLILDSNYLSSYLSSFSKQFFFTYFGSIFMSLILPLDMYQIQLKSTQFTNEVYFVEGLANYTENIT